MLKVTGIVYAVVFIVVGILGFIPPISPMGNLLGLFEVDITHNIVHLLTGIIAGIVVIIGNVKYIRLYFQVFGIVYAAVAILGFIFNGNLIIITLNLADNILHVVIAAVSLFFGYFIKAEE